jgi:hypothetical protein
MHPLGPDLTNINDDELNKKFGELQKRYMQCWRFGPSDLLPQLQMLMDDYQAEIQRRNAKVMEDMQKRAEAKGKGFGGVIDVS